MGTLNSSPQPKKSENVTWNRPTILLYMRMTTPKLKAYTVLAHINQVAPYGILKIPDPLHLHQPK